MSSPLRKATYSPGEPSGSGDAGIFGSGGKITVTLSADYTYTYNVSQTLGSTVTIPVLAGDYGWIEPAELATQVTGSWTFDVGGFPWTANDTVSVPIAFSTTGGAGTYTAKTASTFISRSAQKASAPHSPPALAHLHREGRRPSR